MKAFIIFCSIGMALAMPQPELMAGWGCGLAPGETEIFYMIPQEPGCVSSSEGIAADWVGNVYISNRIGWPGYWIVNEIIKVSPWGGTSILAELGTAAPGAGGIVGLTTDWMGNVYACFPSGNENHGVWRISRNGYKERLSGSEHILVPNALTLDWRGNVYVSDSYPANPDGPGLIWKYGRRTRHFEIWACDVQLAPYPYDNPASPPPGTFDGPGANGVAFVPPNDIYVANHEKSTILHIPIRCDGSAGEVTVVASGGVDAYGMPNMLFAPDGLSADRDGNLYAAMPLVGNAPFPMTPVLKIYPDTGAFEPVVAPVAGILPENFEAGTSLVFGGLFSDQKSLYVANMGLATFGIPGGIGARVTRVGVGVKGIPLQ